MHANATLTPLMRAKMVLDLTTRSLSCRAVAAAYCVSEKTVRRWLSRAREAGFPQRLYDRSSTPHHQPWQDKLATRSPASLTLRRERRSYAADHASAAGFQGHAFSRATPSSPQPLEFAGSSKASGHALLNAPNLASFLHLDIKKLGRFEQPGVRATGDRTFRNRGAGVESLHVAVDDHSRLAFACLFPNEKIPSVLHALHQSVCFYAEHGIRIQRVLTDRGPAYRSRLFASACRELGLKHSFTKPYRPQTNGKAERFIQSVTHEWAFARSYDSSQQRATFLPHYLHDYNFHRPHSALNSLPPSSRLPKTADNLSRINN